MTICEVRIPTYKRPDLLKRAIDSLRCQSCEDWKAIVMDDSPHQEGKDVVNLYGDERLIYSPNIHNLGRSANLDRAFQSKSYLEAKYAFVLEDDNYLLPDFILENITSVHTHQVSIVLRNQEMRLEKQGESQPMGRTTRGDWFEPKIYQPLDMYAYLFFHTGISNGGLFWDTQSIKSNLQVGQEVEHSSFQEMFRCLQVVDDIYFEPEPLCIFTLFDQRDDIPKTFSNHQNRLWSRGQQSIYMFLLNKLGESVVISATNIAEEKGFRRHLESLLIDSLYVSGFKYTCYTPMELAKIWAKSLLRYLLYPDPFKKHYSQEYYQRLTVSGIQL